MTALQLFDALPAHIEDALRASIRRFGVLVPVVRDQHGRIIDGHHRSRIADEFGVEYRVDVREVADDEEAREIARTLNSDRRHLDEEQRRKVAAELRIQGHSYRAIGGALGVSHTQARHDVETARLESGFQSEPDRVARQGGGSYPSTRPALPAASVAAGEPDPLPVDVPGTKTFKDDDGEPYTVKPAGEGNWRESPFAVGQALAGQPAIVEPKWSEDEEALLARLDAGETVVVSLRAHHANLVRDAEATGRLVRIDRRTEWGNPFETPADGDRATVIANYRDHYLPHKPSLLARLAELRGKALACWCAPDACHGDVLKEAAAP